MAEQKWTMRGEYMESCNCDYLCPCIYTNPQGPVTYDDCTAALVFRIDQGRCGETSLDGLKFALVIRSGKVMADGNWIFGGVVDERAEEAQRAGACRDRQRRGWRTARHDPRQSRQRLPGRRVQTDRLHPRRACTLGRDSRKFSPSRSRASPHATAAANRSTSTTRRTRRAGVWPWRGQSRCIFTASGSTWILSARAITGISRPLPGRPEAATAWLTGSAR